MCICVCGLKLPVLRLWSIEWCCMVCWAVFVVIVCVLNVCPVCF